MSANPYQKISDQVLTMMQDAAFGPWDQPTVIYSIRGELDNPQFEQLVPHARTPQEKISLSEAALTNNYEGLVLKRKESTYQSGGRTPDWLKVKFVTTIDCIVLNVRDDGKESVRLGLLNDAGDVQEVGRASLIGKEKNAEIQVGDVIELKYLYAGANGRLYQPTIVRRRDDKPMQQCTTDQLKFVNKDVLEAL